MAHGILQTQRKKANRKGYFSYLSILKRKFQLALTGWNRLFSVMTTAEELSNYHRLNTQQFRLSTIYISYLLFVKGVTESFFILRYHRMNTAIKAYLCLHVDF